jgi:hypothetical protein
MDGLYDIRSFQISTQNTSQCKVVVSVSLGLIIKEVQIIWEHDYDQRLACYMK